MQPIEISGRSRSHLPIQLLRIAESPGLMVGEGGLEEGLDLGR